MKRLNTTNLRQATWIMALGMIVLCAWSARTPILKAQEEPAKTVDADKKTEKKAAKEPQSLGKQIFGWPENPAADDYFAKFFYIVLFFFSLWALTIIIERLVNLVREKVIPPEFLQQLQRLLRDRQDTVENLRSLSESSNSPIAKILKGGVLRAGRTLPEVEKSMEDATAREMALLRSRNRPLNVIASTAPLVGLLGTVVGMIFAFQGSTVAQADKAVQLAGGIYLALLTTAAGLTIAIPCLLLGAYFNTKVERFMWEMDQHLMETLPSFTKIENQMHLAASNPSAAQAKQEATDESPVAT